MFKTRLTCPSKSHPWVTFPRVLKHKWCCQFVFSALKIDKLSSFDLIKAYFMCRIRNYVFLDIFRVAKFILIHRLMENHEDIPKINSEKRFDVATVCFYSRPVAKFNLKRIISTTRFERWYLKSRLSEAKIEQKWRHVCYYFCVSVPSTVRWHSVPDDVVSMPERRRKWRRVTVRCLYWVRRSSCFFDRRCGSDAWRYGDGTSTLRQRTAVSNLAVCSPHSSK